MVTEYTSNVTESAKETLNQLIDINTQRAIENVLKRGNSIEIHPSKDGIKIYEIRKSVLQ